MWILYGDDTSTSHKNCILTSGILNRATLTVLQNNNVGNV